MLSWSFNNRVNFHEKKAEGGIDGRLGLHAERRFFRASFRVDESLRTRGNWRDGKEIIS